jgi:hypothetical protein
VGSSSRFPGCVCFGENIRYPCRPSETSPVVLPPQVLSFQRVDFAVWLLAFLKWKLPTEIFPTPPGTFLGSRRHQTSSYVKLQRNKCLGQRAVIAEAAVEFLRRYAVRLLALGLMRGNSQPRATIGFSTPALEVSF